MKYVALILLSGCASHGACPVPSTYTIQDFGEQAQAEADAGIDDNSPLAPVIHEWARLRAESRACSGE